MKEYIFMILAFVLLSCSDDDEPNLGLSATTYSGNQLVLSLDSDLLEGRVVKLNPEKGRTAELCLSALLPGEEETRVLVTGEENGHGISIKGSDENEDRTLAVTGEIKDGKLLLQATVKIHSDIVGKWNLPLGDQVPINRLDNSAVYIDLVNTEMTTILLPVYLYNGNTDANNKPLYDYPQMASIEKPDDGKGRWFAECVMNGALTSFYSSVLSGIEFTANGRVRFTIVPWGDDKSGTLPVGELRYGVRGDKIWFVGEREKSGIGTPFLLKQDERKTKIEINKELLDSYVAVSPYLKVLLNYQKDKDMFHNGKATEESIRTFVDENMLQLLRTSERFELGVNLRLKENK